MVSTAKKNRHKAQREAAVRIRHQMDSECRGGEEDTEIVFRPIVQPETDSIHDSSPTPSAAMDIVHVIDMVGANTEQGDGEAHL